MLLKHLRIVNFRNIEELSLDLGPSFNLIIGRNAQGKTNIVESIRLISTGQSFRTHDYRDMIRTGTSRAEVKAKTQRAAGDDDVAVIMDEGKKVFLRNEKRALPKGGGGTPTVLFAPEEIMLLREAPGVRRRYMDGFIVQLSKTYRGIASKYERVVRQRNRILTDPIATPAQKRSALKPWNEQLSDLGARIMLERDAWCQNLNAYLPENYREIAPQDGEARFLYQPQCGAAGLLEGHGQVCDAIFSVLQLRQEDELIRGTTLVGPHRDDFLAIIGQRSAKQFGSQGQHRSFVLSLKLAEMDLLRQETGEEPLLLLDDVASELDAQRNAFFFEKLDARRGQVFITSTSADDVKLRAGGDMRLYEVSAGRVVPRKEA